MRPWGGPGGRLARGRGSGKVKVNSKVWFTAHSGGDTLSTNGSAIPYRRFNPALGGESIFVGTMHAVQPRVCGD